ncbi:carboxypeptidase regulatory-like domain-containing protein [Olleya sp. HaHaR_3_96]|uniref:carboxypeptidase regulatory-like domain-containing protein n=1 Tax=Olleya sp. HaHaR_3_96 TaxID=2745560 RepID=UPI001C4F8DC6|nr:carboxypeptidase regulatory-like domain-containing protein [Olleya sp. HaHaR_3_96]QXP59763.1 carboxypeptidase regulatory-like domain-containing protein [Olleya sp. HaHaR_3_96]
MKITSKYISLFFMLTVLISCSEDKVSLSGAGVITGKVVSKGENEPLENTKISTSPSTSIVFTNASGDFVINTASVGTYSIEAQKDGYLSKFESITVVEDNEVNVIFELDVETANNDAPNTPILNSPVNDAINQYLSLDLVWEGFDPEEDDLVYEVQILNDHNSDVLIYTDVIDTTLTVSGLDYNTKYFWQVSASDNINALVLSETFNFTTIGFPANRVFFTRKINENNVIFSVDSEGNEYQLTSLSSNSWRPRKATGLDKLAFLRSNGGQTHIYTMDLDGSNITQVTNNIAVNGSNLEELDFEWKSNNTAFVYSNFDKLYQINTDGSGVVQLHQTLNGNFITEVDWNQSTQSMVVKTNNAVGYNVEIYTINATGVIQDYVLQNVNGAAGGLDYSFDGLKLLYTYDVSGNQNTEYRQLNTHMFIYTIATAMSQDLSTSKQAGTNDLDVRFAPNEADVIFVNTSNDGISQNNIYKMSLDLEETRTLLVNDGKMPDWK